MPIVIITIVLLYFVAFIPSLTNMISSSGEKTTGMIIQSWTNPLYGFGSLGLSGLAAMTHFDTSGFIASIVTPLYWAAIFLGLGLLTFNRKDVK